MKKIIDTIFSTRLMGVLVLIFAVAMAVATFVENDFGTQTAKALIYNAWWFEAIMFLLTINFIGNIFRYKLYRKEKWPVLLFHISFIVTLFGAFVTRYFGFEGIMPIREGETATSILSDKTYLQVTIDDGKDQKQIEKEVLFGKLNNNHFTLKDEFKSTPFEIEYVDYVPNAMLVFTPNEKGREHVHLVLSLQSGRQDIYIPDGEVVQVGEYFFTFNKPQEGAMNFIQKENGLMLQASEVGKFMEMKTQDTTVVFKDSLSPAQYLKLYSFSNAQFVLTGNPLKGEKAYVPASKAEKDMNPNDALYVNVTSNKETKQIILLGAKNNISEAQKVTINGLNLSLNYGSKALKTPFGVKLRDFQLERYPGTNSASSYASEVTVIDTDKSFDFRIYMNHVLDYKGYRLYQASYNSDELGTILSVNHDYWGTLITYIGYFLMGLGMFFTLFWNGSRFKDLSEKLKKINKNKVTTLLLLIGLTLSLSAQNDSVNSMQAMDTTQHSANDGHNHNVDSNIPPVNNIVSKEHAEKFGKLLIQDFQGRFKPINTYALETMRKVYKKDTYNDLTAEQVILSAQIDPYYWGEQYLIHVKSNAIGKKICSDLDVKDGYASAANFFRTGEYYLAKSVEDVSIKKNIDRNATDKEVINLDERFNVLLSVLNGDMLRIYPKKGDLNNKWYSAYDESLIAARDTAIFTMHQEYLKAVMKGVNTGDYKDADVLLEKLNNLQLTIGADIIPSQAKVNLEIKYNHWNIFKKLMMYYMFIGFVFLILAFINLFFNESKLVKNLLKLFTVLTILGMILHVIGLGTRWYISGHEPWSNGYEAVVFVAFISTLAGLIFSHKKSKFTLAATVIFASFLLGIAHGSLMNPEITNLVPVLKSYWLMIHVAVITSSYGFLGLGALLGVIVLFLYILRTPENKSKIDKTIDELTYVNESTLIVGLFALSIGTFLGGVWANESWGRYWSWDPKEVWSLISMMVYVFVLHMRLVPGLRGKFAFNMASLFAISTLIMTFFGVNFYLSGMHSYAAGDPIPIPNWIYFAVAFFVLFTIFSYWKFKKIEK